MVMKILDWMNRKLHPVTDYSRVSQRRPLGFEEDAGDLAAAAHKSRAYADVDRQAEASLLLHVLDGILSIGTLGHPHPILLPDPCSEPKEPEPEPEPELPKVEKPPVRITVLSPTAEMLTVQTEQSLEVVASVAEEKITAEIPLLKEDRERKERTTLADLLAADLPETVDAPHSGDGASKKAVTVRNIYTVCSSTVKSSDMVKNKLEKKNKVYEVNSLSFSASTKRIRKMITKMMKKKIYPEASGPAQNVSDTGITLVGVDPLLRNHSGRKLQANLEDKLSQKHDDTSQLWGY